MRIERTARLRLVFCARTGGSASELAGHGATVPQRADAQILMDAQTQGALAPSAGEEHIELEIFPVASLPGPHETSKDVIEKRNLLQDPAMAVV